MIRFKHIVCLLGIILCSCKNSEKKQLTGKDTFEILQAILNSKSFVKDNVCYTDTLYFLKTKFYNKSWPRKSKYFKITSIEEVPQAKILNIGPNYPYDGRRRFSVFYFDIKENTSTVKLLEHGANLFFVYKLKIINDKWTIVEENLSTGGRRMNYGFENEQWYLDMKKKIKPVKPMFPPAEPKEK